MICKAAGLKPGGRETPFADNAGISSWARASIAEAVKKGIMKGYPGNLVKPADNASRAEAMTVVDKALTGK
ncbi:MAG: S-layer homology domain-containing protein [Bacillota bacterium]